MEKPKRISAEDMTALIDDVRQKQQQRAEQNAEALAQRILNKLAQGQYWESGKIIQVRLWWVNPSFEELVLISSYLTENSYPSPQLDTVAVPLFLNISWSL